MTNAAIYCRVDHGSSKYGQVAIDCQRKQMERYAKLHNMYITGCYADCGFTGRSMNRPALQQLLQDHAKGSFDMVLVVNYSRLFCGDICQTPQWPFRIAAVNRQSIRKEHEALSGKSTKPQEAIYAKRHRNDLH